jgi:hypothetical protein
MPQYNVAAPDSFASTLAQRVRRNMFEEFMRRLAPTGRDIVLDVGVTSDRSYDASNYFEALYPFPAQITAVGIEDAAFLQNRYAGVKFVRASALDLPFPTRSFDLVHSAAVLEHVGSAANQKRMVSECLRVARRGVCLTTPNRWFPIELHTHLPFIHWFPPPLSRKFLRGLGHDFFADERNLNLMSCQQLRHACAGNLDWVFAVARQRLLGWTSNLMLFAVPRSNVNSQINH